MWMWLNICRRNVKYNRFVAIRCVFSSSKYSKIRFRPGLCPGPRWGAYDAPPDPVVGWAGGHPFPIPFPPWRLQSLDLGAFGASVLRPPNTNSWLRLWTAQDRPLEKDPKSGAIVCLTSIGKAICLSPSEMIHDFMIRVAFISMLWIV